MESQEQACRMSVPKRNMSVCKITDETFPYMSGIFEETMDPSCMANEPRATADLPEQVQLKKGANAQDGVISGAGSAAKAAYNSWLSIPMDNGHSIDFSMSLTSALDDHKDMDDVTESKPKAAVPDAKCHSPECASGTEKCHSVTKSNNSTFDMAKDLKVRFSELNLTKPGEATGSNNVTFEKSGEKSSTLTISNDDDDDEDASVGDKRSVDKCFHTTLDVNSCSSSNSSAEHPSAKLNGTVDIARSTRNEEEKIGGGRSCSQDCEKQSTYTEETNATVDLTAGMTTDVVKKPGSMNVEPDNRTFTQHNSTTDLTRPEPAPCSTVTENTEIPEKSNTDCVTEKDTPVPSQSPAPVRVDVTLCTDGTRDLSEPVVKEEQQDLHSRVNGTSDGEDCFNLDTSTFSLDEILHLRRCPFVISTPIVLERGFGKLGSLKPTSIQKELSVINSINTQTNDDTAGVSKHEGFDEAKANRLPVQSDACGEIRDVPSNAPSEAAAAGSKPLSKLAARRKIPRPALKSGIPKTQLPLRPTTLHVNSAVAKWKASTQAFIQPEPSSALPSTRRTVPLNKGKTLSSSKDTSASSSVTSLSVSTAADKKGGNTCPLLPKPSGLPPPSRGRFGLRPPGGAVSSEEISHAQTANKPTGLSGIRTRNSLLPGFPQKHTSSDALPVAKRKKTDPQHQTSSAEAPARHEAVVGVPKNVTPPTDITMKRPDAVKENPCGKCTLLQEKLRAFHEQIGRHLQELGRPADCKKWVLVQQKLETCWEEIKRLQTEHV